MYNIKTLCEKANISQQTFYRLTRENEEFRALVEANKQKKGNGFRYTEAVLEWLCDYRGISQEQQEPPQPTASSEKPVEAAETPSEPPVWADREKELLGQIEGLEREITRLTAALDDKEQERKALFLQNANLLMLLTQEKAEKQALLPPPQPPKLPLGQRIKAFFGGNKTPSNEEQPDS